MRANLFSALVAGTLAGSLFLSACSPKVGAAVTAAEMSAVLPASPPTALIHFYRPGKMAGFAIGYDVRVNDSVTYRARNSSQLAVTHRPGVLTISAKTEAREEIHLNVEPGREYFVRCTIGMGALVGRPHLTQVSVAEGRRETVGLAVLGR
jgi:hypothetical protein